MARDIYVQSCGFGANQDYSWQKKDGDGQSPEIPPLLEDGIDKNKGKTTKISDLYASQDPSLVILRDGDKLLLLVTALKAVERSKKYGRSLRNSIAFVTENENLIRGTAARILKDWESFTEKVDEAVVFDKEKGFEVKWQVIDNYLNESEIKDIDSKDPDLTIKVAKDSLINGVSRQNGRAIAELAEELQNYRLPKLNDALVVVTGNVSEDLLATWVWRGISERVTSDIWIEKPPKLQPKDDSRLFFWGIIIMFMLIIMIAVGAIYIMANNQQKQITPTPEISIPQKQTQTEMLLKEKISQEKISPQTIEKNPGTEQPEPLSKDAESSKESLTETIQPILLTGDSAESNSI